MVKTPYCNGLQGAMKLFICKSVMRKGENVLEKKLSLNKIQQGGKLCMPSLPLQHFMQTFLCFQVIWSSVESIAINVLILNHDKHIDINESSVAPIREFLHNAYITLLILSLKQYYKMSLFTLSGYQADTHIVNISNKRDIFATFHMLLCVQQ